MTHLSFPTDDAAAPTIALDRPRRFDITPFFRVVALATPVACLAMALGASALPMLPQGPGPRNPDVMPIFSAVLTTLFCIGAAFGVRIAIGLPSSSITVDEDGLWPSRRSKASSLVKWADIARFRDRPRLQRLDLMDRAGAVLAKLEYQLEDFDMLRAIVLERTSLARAGRLTPSVHTLPLGHHALHIVLILCLVGVAAPIVPVQPLTVGLALLAAIVFVIKEYRKAPYRIRIMPRMLMVDWPLRRRIIRRSEVQEIAIGDTWFRGSRTPTLLIFLTGEPSPIVFGVPGMSVTDIHHQLEAWAAGGH